MFRSTEKSFFERVLTAEREKFFENAKQYLELSEFSKTIDNGNVLYKIPINRTSTKALLSKNNTICFTPDSKVINKEGAPFMRSVSTEFLNIPLNGTFIECMKTIYPYVVNAGEHFYGVILRSTSNPDIILNPFHILTTLAVMDSDEHLEHKYNIILYFHTDRQKANIEYRSGMLDPSKIRANLDSIMQTYTNKSPIESIVDRVFIDEESGDVNVLQREKQHPDDDPEKMHLIVAHQILTKGIIVPYYGTSLIEWSNGRSSCQGTHLSPFMSCNINGNAQTYTSNNQNTGTGSVCTGSEPSNTVNGLHTLTHANLDSPHNRYIIRPGALDYADAMVAKATEIYLAAGILEPITPYDPMTQFTEEELTCTTLSEFIKVRKSQSDEVLALSDLRAQFGAMQELVNAPIEEPVIEDSYVFTLPNSLEVKPEERIVYVNSKSGRRVEGDFIKVEDSRIFIRDYSSGRRVSHLLTSIQYVDSAIIDGTLVFVGDTITIDHKLNGIVRDFTIEALEIRPDNISINDGTFLTKYINSITLQGYNNE